MLAFSIDYYGMIFRATQSVELFCAYAQTNKVNKEDNNDWTQKFFYDKKCEQLEFDKGV